jgi:hypothetical protein
VKVLGLLFCAVLFVAGLVAPKRSRQLQRKIARFLRRGERKSGENAGKAGDLSRKTLKLVRRGSDESAEAGRGLREKMPG